LALICIGLDVESRRNSDGGATVSAEAVGVSANVNRKGYPARISWNDASGNRRGKRQLHIVDYCVYTGPVVIPLPPSSSSSPSTIQVAVGSEDLKFLQDPVAVDEFERQHLNVEAIGYGSGQLAFTVPPKGYSAFFLSSTVFAEMAEARLNQTIAVSEPFSTPLVVLTWQPLIPLLQTLGIVNTSGQFDIGKYLAKASTGVRWDEIPGNTFYHNSAQVLLRMTNPTESDSGAMFVAAASYVLNGDQVLTQTVQAKSKGAQIANVLRGLGELQPTTNLLFQQYLTEGMNGAPMVLGYQSEFVGEQRSSPRSIPVGAAMLQLDVPVDCIHTVLPLNNDGGTEFANLLTTDPVLQQLASKYGFQIAGSPGSAGSTNPIPKADIMKELIHDATP
jgi:hypothetical protein